MGFNGIDSDWARNLTTNGISREDKWIYPALWLRKMAHIDGVATKKKCCACVHGYVARANIAVSTNSVLGAADVFLWHLIGALQ